MIRIGQRILPPLIVFTVLFGGLEIATHFEWISPQLLPPLSAVIKTFFELHADFLKAFLETSSSVLLGLISSCILGLCLAISFSLSNFLKRAVLPFAIFFQTVPIIAIAPLLVIYFGFGPPTVIASSLIVSIFPVIANTLIGLESISPGQIELFQLYHASRWQTLLKLRLPSAYPAIYSGLKVTCGLSVIGAIAGEFVAGGGLGALIDSARTQQRIDIVFVCLFLLSLLGLALVGALRFLHLALQRYRPYGLTLKD